MKKVKINPAASIESMVKDKRTVVFELVSNGIEEGNVEVSFENVNNHRILVVKNSGKPVKDFSRMVQLSRDDDDDEIDNTTNHLRMIGFKLPVCYCAKRTRSAVVYSKYKSYFIKMTVNYKTLEWDTEKYPVSEWPFGDWTTVVEIPMERQNLVFNDEDMLRELGRKYAIALLKGTRTIVWNGQKVKPTMHASVVTNHNNGLEPYWKNADGVVDMENVTLRRYGSDKTCIVSVVNCEAINGTVEILWQHADQHEGESDTTGITVYNNGIMVERTGLRIIANNATYGHDDVAFKALASGRFECNALATYVNLCPGPGIEMPFSGDKVSVDWFDNEVGIQLRKFLDDAIGHKYREEFRISGELKDRVLTDALLQAFGDYKHCNQAFLQEVSVRGTDGKVRQISDGVMLRVTGANEAKIDKYYSDRENGRKSRYVLDAADFKSESTRKNVKADVIIVEYKALSHTQVTDADIAQLTTTVDTITRTLRVSRNMVYGVLLGNSMSVETDDVMEYKKAEDGYELTYRKYTKEN